MPDKLSDISTYSASDLMRYATGLMPAAEMYALEKAALEDSFLAEALDGYVEAMASQQAATVQPQVDWLALAAEKEERKDKAVVVPLWQRSSLRIAVAALFVIGAGWAVFSLLQKPATPANSIAQQPSAKQPGGMDSFSTVKETTPPPATDSNRVYADLAAPEREAARPPVPAMAPASGTVAMAQTETADKFTVSATPYKNKEAIATQPDTIVPGRDVASGNIEAETKDEKTDTRMAMQRAQAQDHFFKGQITDAKNNPVPYANVMIDGQDVGTYSDMSGHFNFVSDDSTLRIKIRSVGYTNQAAALHTGPAENRIMLQEDQQLNNSLPLTVQSKKQVAAPVQKSIVERDSIVGLEASTINAPYYDLYLLNNNRISTLPTQNRQVELSFDVSKTGEATNITVIKSSGGKVMDEEAVRLVKEGPKLNADTKPGKKKTITIRF